MISHVRIERFKCFEDQLITFSKLTLLAGANGAGKSTAIQSILLLRQSRLEDNITDRQRLVLNGDLVQVGTAKDAIYIRSQEDNIRFTLAFEDYPTATYSWVFLYDKASSHQHFLLASSNEYPPHLGPFDECFSYLVAERWGPRLTYPMSESARDSMSVGTRGEYAAHCLAEFGSDPIPNVSLSLPNEDGQVNFSLENQTQLWMRRLVPDIVFHVDSILKADRVRLEARFFAEQTDYLRPTNMGFGITYSLPIVVAALMARKNTMLIVENPEAHLHPASQSQMGQFLAQVASAGVQVVLETHSDHILNGVRIAVMNKLIDKESVDIQFFDRGSKTGETRVIKPKMYENGRLDSWPKGFFDQLELDLEKLI